MDCAEHAAAKNGLELRSAIASLFTSTDAFNRSATLSDIFDPSNIPLTYSGSTPADYSADALSAVTGLTEISSKYVATQKEMMIFANYIMTSSNGPDFSGVSSALTPDQFVCAWFTGTAGSCDKVYIQIYDEDMDLVTNESTKYIEDSNSYKDINVGINFGRYTLLAVAEEMYNYLEAITVNDENTVKEITVVAKNACGNGIIDAGEECETGDLDSTEVLCRDIFHASTNPENKAVCNKTTCVYDKTACGAQTYSNCGDGIINPGKGCDGGTKACSEILGATAKGTASCKADCLDWVTAGSCTKTTAECAEPPANTIWNDGIGRFTQTYNGYAWIPATKEAAYGHNFWAAGDYRNSEKAWRINDNGALESVEKATENYVICVRVYDYDPLENRFTTADETVTDNASGLIWQKQYASSKSWGEALSHCEDASTDGHFDWRLPNRNELASIIDFTKSSGAASSLSSVPDQSFWTSTSSVTETTKAWAVDFADGSISAETKSGQKYVLCVRSENICLGDESECVDPCDFEPCRNTANSTGVCTATGGTFYCGCKSGFDWNAANSKCIQATTRYEACTGLPENAKWNTVPGISQIWNGNEWEPSNESLYSQTPATDRCYFKCKENHEWLNNNCEPKQQTRYCVIPEHTVSNTAATIIQTWNEDEHSWEPSEETYTWDNRAAHCNALNSSNYGGRNNWRVPNPHEFMTIVDHSTYDPATDSYFTGMPADSTNVYFWTSKESKYYTTTYAHGFYLKTGTYSYKRNKSSAFEILCVSGNEMRPATSANFTTQTINEQVVVTDSATGLMWQKDYTTQSVGWRPALQYCADLTYAGYSDWRLPNKNELLSLINYEKPEKPSSYFPDMPSYIFWSSTPYAGDNNAAYNVDFSITGFPMIADRSEQNTVYHVRCVR